MDYHSAIKSKEGLMECAKPWMSLEHIYGKSKTLVTKDHILCNSTYMKCPEQVDL